MDKEAQQIVDTVASAVTAVAPLAGPYAPIVAMAVNGIRAIISFVDQLGHGDAIREALDAELAAGRNVNDQALAGKKY